MGPLPVDKMSELQNNTVKAESELREKYHIKVSLKKTMWTRLSANVDEQG